MFTCSVYFAVYTIDCMLSDTYFCYTLCQHLLVPYLLYPIVHYFVRLHSAIRMYTGMYMSILCGYDLIFFCGVSLLKQIIFLKCST